VHPQRGPLKDFFSHWIEGNRLVDLEPLKLSQTWWNGRKGDFLVAKRLDRFLISEYLLENPWIFKSKLVVGGMFDHMPILLKIDKRGSNPPSLLKYNHAWLLEEDYRSLVESY
jgi:hypothetical protein